MQFICNYCASTTNMAKRKCGHILKLAGVVSLLLILIYTWGVPEKFQYGALLFGLQKSRSFINGSSNPSPLHLNNQETPMVKNDKKDTAAQLKETKTDKNEDLRNRFLERKSKVQNTCAGTKELQKFPKCEETAMTNNLFYVKEHSLLFCAIEKTGSTFWRRLLHIAGGWGSVSNPMRMEIGKAYVGNGGYKGLAGWNRSEIQSIFKSSKSIMFVRDPLSKLFSGWLDKLYSPNVHYWKLLGNKIAKTRKPLKFNETLQCGFDISFVEFVNYTTADILTKPCIDNHFAPNYNHCLPCNYTYDFIGNYETFMEDTMYLINAFNLSDKVKFDDFEKDANLDAIKDAVEWVFSQRKNVVQCHVSFGCALFRVWERLRSRGVIGNEVQFPYSNRQQADNVTKIEFENVLKKAYQQSDVKTLKLNRKWALHQAFTDLPSQVVNQVKLAFGLDFELFNYNLDPYHHVDEKTDFIYFKPCPAHLL